MNRYKVIANSQTYIVTGASVLVEQGILNIYDDKGRIVAGYNYWDKYTVEYV